MTGFLPVMKHIRSLILATLMFAGIAPAFAQAPPPVPALPDTERRTSYSISSSTCACAVGFQLYQDSTDVANWVKVYINGVEVPQSGNWNITSPSGSIGVLSRPITDAILTFTAVRTGTVQIVGAQRPRRLSEFAENRGVAARDLNQVLNGIEAQLREMWDRQFRTLQAPPGDTLALLPLLANRTSMGACFDSGGNLTSCVSVPSSTFAAGNGITLTGTGPTTIAANLAAVAPIVLSGTNPISISCPTCGFVTSIAGNQGAFTLSNGLTNVGNDLRVSPGIGLTISGGNVQFASGTIIGSTQGTYTTNASLATTIPADDTIPQSNEGTAVISVNYTPRSASSTLRVRFMGQGSCDSINNFIAAIFNAGSANAFAAQNINITVANNLGAVALEGNYAPGSTSAQTIFARVGCNSGNSAMNGFPGQRRLGSASVATLTVEEIAP